MDKFDWLQEQLVKAGKLKKPVDLKTVTAPQVSRAGAEDDR